MIQLRLIFFLLVLGGCNQSHGPGNPLPGADSEKLLNDFIQRNHIFDHERKKFKIHYFKTVDEYVVWICKDKQFCRKTLKTHFIDPDLNHFWIIYNPEILQGIVLLKNGFYLGQGELIKDQKVLYGTDEISFINKQEISMSLKKYRKKCSDFQILFQERYKDYDHYLQSGCHYMLFIRDQKGRIRCQKMLPLQKKYSIIPQQKSFYRVLIRCDGEPYFLFFNDQKVLHNFYHPNIK